MGPDIQAQTIQYRTHKSIANELDMVLNDDGPGEAADLVGLRESEPGAIRFWRAHCSKTPNLKP